MKIIKNTVFAYQRYFNISGQPFKPMAPKSKLRKNFPNPLGIFSELEQPHKWTTEFSDFLLKCLVKKVDERWGASQLLMVSLWNGKRKEPGNKQFNILPIVNSHRKENVVAPSDFSGCTTFPPPRPLI